MAKGKSEAEVVFKATDDGLKSTLKGITAEMQKNNAESKLVQAQLKLTGSDTEKLASQLSSLEKSYDLQSQKVQTTSERLANAKKYYGENSTEVQRLEKELIQQQTAQQNLANKIDQTSDALSKAKGDVNDYSSTMGKLDDEQKQLQASASLVESEYKKWQATAGQTASESEKLAKAQDYVADQSDIAQKKIGILEQKLNATQKEFGETSTEALEMKAKLNEAETEFAELGKAASDIETSEGLEGMNKKLDMNNIMQATEQLSQIGDKLIDVGKNAIEAAGEANAMSAKFSQVFGNLEKEAESSVEEMGNKFGMLPNRIKPLYAQLTSMFKGLGYDTKDAMGLAETATTSAADAAAFYDKSMEDASSSLTSFVKGNYEGGESIGLFANDTQMAAYAVKNNLIPATEGAKQASEKAMISLEKAQKAQSEAIEKHGKNSLQAREAAIKLKDAQAAVDAELGPQTQKWADLDEATKQAVRLDYVSNMQKQSGAMGQAAREMDGYENQMGNMKQALQDFYAELGKDFLPDFINILKGGVGALQQFSSFWTSLPGPVKTTIAALGGLIAVLTILSPAISAIATIGPVVGSAFGAITTLFAEGGALAGVGTFISGTLIPAIGGMISAILPFLPIIAAVAAAIGAAILIFKNWGTITDWISEKWSVFTSFLSDLWNGIKNTAENVWNGLKAFFQTTVGQIVLFIINPIAGLVNAIAQNWDAIKKGASAAWTWIKNTVSNLITGTVNTAKSLWSGLINFLSNLWTGAKNTASNLWNGIKSVIGNAITGAKNTVSNVANTIKSTVGNIWSGIKNTTSNVWNSIKSAITSPIEAAKNTVSGIIDRIKGLFNFRLSFPSVSIPHIPLPHFSMSGSINPLSDNFPPRVSVSWYAKGGIFTKPSIFGMANGNLLGAGEAGPEAALPLNRQTLGDIGRGIVNATPILQGVQGTSVTNDSSSVVFNITNHIDSGSTADSFFEKIDQWIANKSTQVNFGTTGRGM